MKNHSNIENLVISAFSSHKISFKKIILLGSASPIATQPMRKWAPIVPAKRGAFSGYFSSFLLVNIGELSSNTVKPK